MRVGWEVVGEGLRLEAELATPAGERRKARKGRKGGALGAGMREAEKGGWEGRRRRQGKQRDEGARVGTGAALGAREREGAERNRSRRGASRRLLQVAQNFAPWRLADPISHRRRRLPRPVTEAKADFDCSAVAGPTPGLRAPGSPGGSRKAPRRCGAGSPSVCLR